MRVLVVEDDARLAEVLSSRLIAEGFNVDVVGDGLAGYWHAREGVYDAVVLDIMLPSLNGYKVAEWLRRDEIWTPILMLTAKDGELDEPGSTGEVGVRWGWLHEECPLTWDDAGCRHTA